jgi:hypothetical protein
MKLQAVPVAVKTLPPPGLTALVETGPLLMKIPGLRMQLWAWLGIPRAFRRLYRPSSERLAWLL